MFLFLSLKEEKEEEDRTRKGKKRRDKSKERRNRRGNVRDEHEKNYLGNCLVFGGCGNRSTGRYIFGSSSVGARLPAHVPVVRGRSIHGLAIDVNVAAEAADEARGADSGATICPAELRDAAHLALAEGSGAVATKCSLELLVVEAAEADFFVDVLVVSGAAEESMKVTARER